MKNNSDPEATQGTSQILLVKIFERYLSKGNFQGEKKEFSGRKEGNN
jgi:hypothetical protein